MSTKIIRYRCQNCGKSFELPEEETLRCPSCFWTSSVRPLEEVSTPAPVSKPSSSPQPAKSKGGRQGPKLVRVSLIIILLALLGVVGFFYVVKGNFQANVRSIILNKLPVFTPSDQGGQPRTSSTSDRSRQASALSVLSEEERAVLLNQIPFVIPRKLSEEEMQIINRKVDFSMDVDTLSQPKFWTLDAFKSFLAAEQKKRGIYFSWSYERSLAKLFDHYLKAEGLMKGGQPEAAQLELLTSLVFPVYANNIRLHRSVALVMLQELINDTLNKIKIVNSYLLKQSLAQQVRELKENYDSFFAVVKESQWDEAIRFVERLEEKAKSIETRMKQFETKYPPIIAQIDQDIQKGLAFREEISTSFSASLNSALADLRIKKTTLQQNTIESLQAIKSKYEAALAAIRDHKWEEAASALESLSYPPEVQADAKHKASILSKLIAKPQSSTT